MRAATVADADNMSELDTILFPENRFNERTMKREVENGYVFVEYDHQNDHLVGYLMSRLDGDIIDILRVGVRPKWQGRGVGSRLLQVVLNGTNVMLTVHKDNEGAIRLYRRLGFHIVGEIQSYGLPSSWVMVRPSTSSST